MIWEILFLCDVTLGATFNGSLAENADDGKIGQCNIGFGIMPFFELLHRTIWALQVCLVPLALGTEFLLENN